MDYAGVADEVGVVDNVEAGEGLDNYHEDGGGRKGDRRWESGRAKARLRQGFHNSLTFHVARLGVG